MAKQSYNPQALAGITDYSDEEFQQDMKTYDIDIPDELLYTKEMNHFMLSQVSKVIRENKAKEINPDTGNTFTEKESRKYSEENYKARKAEFKNLNGW